VKGKERGGKREEESIKALAKKGNKLDLFDLHANRRSGLFL